jgi:hypothetical protein
MEILKNISFSIALFLIGAVFILGGLSGGLTTSNFSITVQEAWSKVISIIIGGILVVVAIYVEIKLRPPSDKKPAEKSTVEIVPASADTKSLRAEEFFYTLDDKLAEGFPGLVKDSIRVQILGRTAVNLLGQYEKVFEQLIKSGCEIQLLFVNPLCDASKYLYGSNPEIYRNNIVSASQHLNRLRNIAGRKLQVRVIEYAPPISIIIIEKPDMKECFIQVQLYFLHSAVGRDRPIFKVSHDDKWHNIFRDEFTQLWADSKEWDVSLFLETVIKGLE